MLKRVLVAVVGIPALILLLSAAPSWAAALLLAAMCGVGAWELVRAANIWPEKRPALALCAALIPVWIYLGSPLLPLLLLILFVTVFLVAICSYEKERPVPFAQLCMTIFVMFIFPLMLSCLLRLRLLDGGAALVFVPLCISFGSDTLALFAGMLFGRHRLAPRVSPKKTVEGAVGGLIGGVAGLALLKGILALCRFEMTPLVRAALGWPALIVLGLLGSVVSQIGDLSFSLIKREYGVKDYGKLLPGHGGVLDRFDSVTFTAPFVWGAVTFLLERLV